jgi:hypothetical protein
MGAAILLTESAGVNRFAVSILCAITVVATKKRTVVKTNLTPYVSTLFNRHIHLVK